MNFIDKKVLVCGMARSGQAAVRLLVDLGAVVTAQDMKTAIIWEEDAAIPDVALFLGQQPDDIVANFDLIVISPGIPVQTSFIEKAKTLGIPVWGEMELAYRVCKAPIVAITGTNGKTTVTTLVGDILRRENPGTVVVGNIGIPFTGLVRKLTPENIVVAEVSSFQLETIDAFCPKVSAVLNMTEDHLDRHGNMETYIATKARIFENQDSNDFTVLNLDNSITRDMRSGAQTIFFSEHESPEVGVFLRNGHIFIDGIPAADINGLNIIPQNALAAAAIAYCAGASKTAIQGGLRAFKSVEHRMEYVASSNGVAFYNDSKATNVDAALTGLSAIAAGIILIGGGFDKKADFTPWVAAFAPRVKQLIVIGQTAEQIIAACNAAGFSNYERAADLRDAVSRAINHAQAGDTVLLSPACASWGMFDNFEQRGYLFKQIVRELIT